MIMFTLEGLKHSRRTAEIYSQTAKDPEARWWWRQEARRMHLKILEFERLERLNKMS